MKRMLNLLCVFAVFSGLAACTTPRSSSEISQLTIDYQCGPGGQDPLTVQYTFQGDEALAARVIYQNQVVVLPRSTAGNADMMGNTFRSDSYTWITQKFDYDTVGAARGEMLTRELVSSDTSTVPPADPATEVSNIIVRDCMPVVGPVS